MNVPIDRSRLATTFTELCEISSPSKKEGAIAAHLKEIFTQLGADFIYEDQSAVKTGSEVGNLIIRFNGQMPDSEGLFLSCHMDTVEPGDGIEVLRTDDIFTSKGDTILGGDDKSGIAAIIETMTLLRECQIKYPKVEIIITTCEELGLLGAKHVEYDKIQSRYGYALDSSGIDHVVVGAPAANKIKVEIKGKAAHAGLCPEAGINALSIAAKALNSLKLGRLDQESTSNFGVINGGVATNIIPDLVTLKGEVRSHSPEKLVRYTKDIKDCFQNAIEEWQPDEMAGTIPPSFTFDVENDYPALKLSGDTPVVERIHAAAESIGKTLEYVVAGGGSDANIFCGNGLPTAIVATGMEKVHTLDEQLDLNDLVKLTELIYNLIIVKKSASQ